MAGRPACCGLVRSRAQTMLRFEVLHVRGQRLHILHGDGVVHAGAHAANEAMALDVLDLVLGRARDKGGVELGVAGAERDVGDGAAVFLRGAVEQFAVLEQVVEQVSLCPVALGHGGKSAGLLNPTEHLAAHVDAKGVGRVEHGALCGLGLKVHVLRRLRKGRAIGDQVVAHDDHGHARGSGVFLRAGVDEPVALNVERLRQKAARDVGDQRYIAAVGQLVVHGAKDSVVLADVDVVEPVARGLSGNACVDVGHIGNAVEVGVLGAREQHGLAVLCGLFVRLVGKVAGHDVAGAAAAHEVHGDARKLQRGAALQKQDAVVVGDAQQAAQGCLGVVDDLLVHTRSMAHLEHGHTATAVVHHLVGDLGEHAGGQCGRAC